MKKEKFFYIKVYEYMKDPVRDGFFPYGYLEELETWVEDGKVVYIVSTISEKSLGKRYKHKGWAERKIKTILDMTKDCEEYYPYENKIYKFKFEIVEE